MFVLSATSLVYLNNNTRESLNNIQLKLLPLRHITMSENAARALRGEHYYAFTPELTKARRRCANACFKYNNEGFTTRRRQIELWRA
jgi:hypothetical protein